jgi:hypothetical protein
VDDALDSILARYRERIERAHLHGSTALAVTNISVDPLRVGEILEHDLTVLQQRLSEASLEDLDVAVLHLALKSEITRPRPARTSLVTS